MKTRRPISLVGGVLSPFILFVGLVSFPLARAGLTTAVFPESEDTFEFTNNEAEDAYDLHIHWSRGVKVKEVKPFKKTKGSGTNVTDFSNGKVKQTEKASVTVTWDGSAPEIKEWWWTKENGDRLGQVKTGKPTTPRPPVTPSSTTREGLRTVTFDTSQGRVIVNLPDDIMTGDTISGTVMAEPKGQTDDERAKNTAELSGLVIDIATPKKPDGTGGANVKAAVSTAIVPFIINLPPGRPLAGVSSSNTDTVVIRLTNSSGSITLAGTATVPIEIVSLSLVSVAPIQVQFPTIGQQGHPIEIIGPFDGNSSNTKLMYGPKGSSIQDFEKNTENVSGGFGLLQPLAESPRKSVYIAPSDVNGPVELYLKEAKTETKSEYRNVGVKLTAPKTSLLRGEHTELHVEVNGLQGITQPVPLTLQSNGVITMEGGMYQPLVIQPSQVGADGRYTTTRGITGVQAGGWSSTATVVTLPPLIRLLDPSPPRQLLVNSRTGHYDFCGGPGEKFSGDGQVKADGCSFYFFQSSNEELLIGVLNGCALNNRYWVFAGGLPSVTVDLRVKVDNVNPTKTRVYFSPLSRPAPPVQDVSAFATCP